MNLSLITKGIKVYTSCLSLNSGERRGFESKIKLLSGRATYLSVMGMFSYTSNMNSQSVSGYFYRGNSYNDYRSGEVNAMVVNGVLKTPNAKVSVGISPVMGQDISQIDLTISSCS